MKIELNSEEGFSMFSKYGFLSLSLISFILSGCSSTPQIEYIEIPDFKSVTIVKTEDLPSIEKLLDENERIADAAGKGGASGGVAGLAAGVLLCGTTGPLAGLCISGLGLAGILTGGAGGFIYGAVTGAEGKYAETINQHMNKVGEKYDLQHEMRSRLISQTPANITLQPEQADIIVSPILSSITIEQPRDEYMYLHFTGNLIFSWGQSNGEEYFGKAEFDYNSSTALMEEWNRNRGRMYKEAVFDGVDDLVRQMALRLSDLINRGPQGIEIDQENLL